jgi:hypothetical protein
MRSNLQHGLLLLCAVVVDGSWVPEVTQAGVCLDYDLNCEVYAAVDMCTDVRTNTYLKRTCARSCGHCTPTPAPLTATPNPRQICVPSMPLTWFEEGVRGKAYYGPPVFGDDRARRGEAPTPAERIFNIQTATSCAQK